MGKFILEGVDKCADMGDDLGVDEVNDIDWSVEMRLIMVVDKVVDEGNDVDRTVGMELVVDVDLVDVMGM